MGRKILFITTDQQRYDSLGCNGGTIARTPVVDALAADGINYQRAYNQNTVCMPARSTMLTGQYVRTHGVVANGVPLPDDAPSVAAYLHEQAGYRTALLGKAHFEPGFDLELPVGRELHVGARARPARTAASSTPSSRCTCPTFGKRALAALRPVARSTRTASKRRKGFSPLLAAEPGGDTGAPETRINPIPREWYHTDWVADRTIAYLDSLPDDADWFVWMSFPDPHHPWDPPASELHRVQLARPRPAARSSRLATRRSSACSRRSPRTGSRCGRARASTPKAARVRTARRTSRDDNIREINAMTHIMNELIDEACGRVLAARRARAAGTTTPTCSSPPITASCRATTA